MKPAFLEGQVFHIQILVRGKVDTPLVKVADCLLVQTDSIDEPLNKRNLRGRTVLQTILHGFTLMELRENHTELYTLLQSCMASTGGLFVEYGGIIETAEA